MQDYADNLVVTIKGKHGKKVITGLTQQALQIYSKVS